MLGLADLARRHRPLGMRIPYLFGLLPVIWDNARSVARRAAPFILSALINNAFSVAFLAHFFSHVCTLPNPAAARSACHAGCGTSYFSIAFLIAACSSGAYTIPTSLAGVP